MAKIFLSSTSEDLQEHRRRVLTTLQRTQQSGVAMELFGAEPATPVSVCKRHVAHADLVVVILAYRYGWIPSVAEGGDGEKSITRIEYDTAQELNKPIVAFVVGENSPWTAATEQDRLLAAQTVEEATAVWQAVKALQRFKIEVGSTRLRDTFSTPADLADKVGSAVANWLFRRQQPDVRSASVQLQLQGLLEKVQGFLREGDCGTAITYLSSVLESVHPENRPAVADERLKLAVQTLSVYDDNLVAVAEAVELYDGSLQATAKLWLGKIHSQRARQQWERGDKMDAWQTAQRARQYFEDSLELDAYDPDTQGSLGGLLKRLAEWAGVVAPSQVQALQDAMLAAYYKGADLGGHAYPLLNFIEQRAVLAQRRDSAAQPVLIRPEETDLRTKLQAALQTRKQQVVARQDRPWAAFDLARGRHYLMPNVAGFLEDLAHAVEDARLMARHPDDRYMVTTTCHSLRGLLAANVQMEGLQEGIAYLESVVVSDNWFLERPVQPIKYIEQELNDLHATVLELAEQQLTQLARQGGAISEFIQATELRWSREDEEKFQQGLAAWKRSLEPTEGKLLRALWKLFGAKALEAASGGVPVDWDAAVKLAGDLLNR